MKKWLVIGTVVLMTMFGATYVFAATADNQSPANGGFNIDQMVDACKQVVANFVKDGTITPEQGKVMNDQMNTMAPMMRNMMGADSQNRMGSGNMMGQGSAAQGMPCYDNTNSK